MSISTYLFFILATIFLVAIPGPNLALIVANSIAYGRSFGLITVIGTTTAALILQIIFIVIGLVSAPILTG